MGTNIVDGKYNIYMNQDYNDTDIYLEPDGRFNLHIKCDTLTANEINGTSGLISDKLEVKTDSNNLGLNQLSNQQITDSNTSGIYELQGTSVSIMNSDQNPVRIACGGPKPNNDGSTFGGALTWSSTTGANFTGPVAYRTNTFCNDLSGVYTNIDPESGEWLAYSLTDSPVGSPPFVNILRWNGSNYVYNRFFNNVQKPKIYGNYIALSDLSSQILIYFFNGTTWGLQQTIGSLFSPMYFELKGSQLFILDGDFMRLYTRSGTSWTLTTSVDLQLGVGQAPTDLSVSQDGTVITVIRDYFYIDVYESLEKVATFTNLSYIACSCVTPDSTKIFYTDTADICILSKVGGIWTLIENKTPCTNITSMAANNNRLVCGRPSEGTYGSVSVFHISDYINELVIADTVYADEDFNLIVKSNYKDVTIEGTNVNVSTDNTGAMYINGNMDVLGNVDVGGSLSFNQLIAGVGSVGEVSYGFVDDGDTGMYSSGDGNINWSINGTQKMSLSSVGLTIPTLISSNGVFTLNTYKTTGSFALVNTDWTNLKLTDDVVIQNTALVKSSYGRSGTNAGHRFTNSSSEAMVLIVTANIIIQGSIRCDHQMRIQDDPVHYCQSMSPTQATPYGFSYSSILYVPASKYFEVLVYPETATQIIVSSISGINLQVFRLA